MTLDIWFTNTKPEEHAETCELLRRAGAERLSHHAGENGEEYAALLFNDTDEDLERVVDVCLFYLDRDATERARIVAALRAAMELSPVRHAARHTP